MSRIALGLLVLGLAACTSPESTRARGGGPGADTGNRGEVVLMHEGARPYHGTPRLAAGQPSLLEGARQAHQLSTE